MAGNPPTSYTTDPTLFLYTSLTAGSSHIITATSRLETILKANKIPFRAIDVATDEKARMIWGRRSKGRKLPGLVRYASIVGDLDQIEEWNEYGELKAQIAATLSPYDASKSEPQKVAVAPTATGAAAQPKTTSSAPHIRIGDTPSRTPSGEQHGENMPAALRQASEEAAAKAKENMRARLGLKPQSPLHKSEEQKAERKGPEDQKPEETKSEGKPAEVGLKEKHPEEKKATDQEDPSAQKELEEKTEALELGKEDKSEGQKPEGTKVEEQGENKETQKLAGASQAAKLEPVTASVESDDSKLGKEKDGEDVSSTAGPSATSKEAKGASSAPEKEAV
ncbi:hypothetical protein TMEN_6465 [Trichophyton mentagrophytes]|uniref:Glutaredoxin domain-containing protein n=1 Tax=Trichophyton interdigitale (strain MR816) TaxID=1215338 RepID=A0A059J6G9_TRIIM|nr:hypothetical protein H101_01865 [Trichophyton interdigitale H6]KDB23258.1 hypothetical protein H109_04856 [Trichophyton interdigitale MR816]GBF63804.1 hypothetical protein TMEN_6465 [Trichophyton mentagrophytes]